MFTPQQRKQWSASASGKGKNTVADTAVRSNVWPRQDWLAAGEGEGEEGDDEAVVWRRFREAGMLDEAELHRKDREGLLLRISELEKEVSHEKSNYCCGFLIFLYWYVPPVAEAVMALYYLNLEVLILIYYCFISFVFHRSLCSFTYFIYNE